MTRPRRPVPGRANSRPASDPQARAGAPPARPPPADPFDAVTRWSDTQTSDDEADAGEDSVPARGGKGRTFTGIAAAAALLYAPNFLFVWTNIDAPPRWSDRVAVFWFDVTKADWRSTMMLGVDRSELRDRVAMWAWDARLQFGLLALIAAAAGLIRLWFVERAWALLVTAAFVINTIFVWTYNVGDPHVFFLPSHFLTALAIGALFRLPPELALGSAGSNRIRSALLQVIVNVLDRGMEAAEAVGAPPIEEVVTDKGYHSDDVLAGLRARGIRSYVSEPDRGRR